MQGIIYNSVGTIRIAPKFKSEMVTQVLLGSIVKILGEKKEWKQIESSDGYTGWISGSVKVLNDIELQSYISMPKLIVTSIYTHSYEEPNENSLPVSDLVIGNILVYDEALDISSSNGYYVVQYPDGRSAFVNNADVRVSIDWYKEITLTSDSIVNCALRFKGIPYLWGGTSSKGLDCSGLTKTVYNMHGISLLRDASQQVTQGFLIDTKGEFSELVPGDLLFFGSKGLAYNKKNGEERVVHVGIFIGNNHYIHASDYVRINSLNPDDELYDEFNRKRYLRTKRYIEKGKLVNVECISLESIMKK